MSCVLPILEEFRETFTFVERTIGRSGVECRFAS